MTREKRNNISTIKHNNIITILLFISNIAIFFASLSLPSFLIRFPRTSLSFFFRFFFLTFFFFSNTGSVERERVLNLIPLRFTVMESNCFFNDRYFGFIFVKMVIFDLFDTPQDMY